MACCLSAVGLLSIPATAESVSSLPPPLHVCGQTLKESEQAGISRLVHPGKVNLRLRHRGVQVLRFAEGCTTGVSLTIAPKHALLALSRARASRGGVIAVLIEARTSGVAHITARHADGTRTIVNVHVLPASSGTEERNRISTG
jgi:hypothetical protein